MLMTPVLRGGLLPAVPMHVSTAPDAGTGKSYLADIASAIATGDTCYVQSAAPGDPAETEKRLVSAALAGHPIIALDNCNGGEGTGSWGLKLSSVEPYAGPDGGNSGDGLFVAHGSLGATLTNYAPDGDGGVTLSAVKMSLTF